MIKRIIKNLNTEFFVLIGLIFVGLVFLIEGQYISKLNETAMRFPKMVFTSLIFLCIIQLATNIIKTIKKVKLEPDSKRKPAISNKRNFTLAVVFLIADSLLIYLLGLIPAVIITGCFFAAVFKYRSRKLSVIYFVSLAVILYLLFDKVFAIRFPEGILITWFKSLIG